MNLHTLEELERSGFKGWRIEDYYPLAEQQPPLKCMFTFCINHADTDPRNVIFLRDGSQASACIPHWQGIFAVLDEQLKLPGNNRA